MALIHFDAHADTYNQGSRYDQQLCSVPGSISPNWCRSAFVPVQTKKLTAGVIKRCS
ncbi:hypothetical protein OK016_01270 [Vibrio chagasii]|nr:hypothetical protein [Vibrio chagasii]